MYYIVTDITLFRTEFLLEFHPSPAPTRYGIEREGDRNLTIDFWKFCLHICTTG